MRVGYDINGQNYALYPFGSQQDAALVDRMIVVFRKYGTFEQKEKKKSRIIKPVYDLWRRIRRISGRQETLEVKLLT